MAFLTQGQKHMAQKRAKPLRITWSRRPSLQLSFLTQVARLVGCDGLPQAMAVSTDIGYWRNLTLNTLTAGSVAELRVICPVCPRTWRVSSFEFWPARPHGELHSFTNGVTARVGSWSWTETLRLARTSCRPKAPLWGTGLRTRRLVTAWTWDACGVIVPPPWTNGIRRTIALVVVRLVCSRSRCFPLLGSFIPEITVSSGSAESITGRRGRGLIRLRHVLARPRSIVGSRLASRGAKTVRRNMLFVSWVPAMAVCSRARGRISCNFL